jgi:hypothetical protein
LGFAKRFPLVAIFAIVLSSCSTSISGKLRSFEGNAIYSNEARVNVVSLDSTELEPQVLTVKEDGSFTTSESLEKGQYMVEALVPGYKPMSIKLNVEKSEDILLKLTPSKRVKKNSFKYHEELDESRGQGGATLVPPMIY